MKYNMIIIPIPIQISTLEKGFGFFFFFLKNYIHFTDEETAWT